MHSSSPMSKTPVIWPGFVLSSTGWALPQSPRDMRQTRSPQWRSQRFKASIMVSSDSRVQDGFVGAKNYLAILHAIDALEPEPPERCTICDIIRIAPVDDLAANEAEHSRRRCLREFFADALNGKEFETATGRIPSRPISARLCHAVLWDRKTTRGFHSRTRKRSGPSKGSRTGSAVQQTKRRSQEPSRPFMMTFFARSTLSVVPFRKLSGTPPTDGKLANVLRRGCCKGKASSGAQKASSSAFAAC